MANAVQLPGIKVSKLNFMTVEIQIFFDNYWTSRHVLLNQLIKNFV